jgi:putative endonuclease
LSSKAQRARYREAAKVARRSPKGEDGPMQAMKYVYLLQSIEHPEQNHVGMTDDLKSRFEIHNAGGSPHTAKYKPWRLVTDIAFSDDAKA